MNKIAVLCIMLAIPLGLSNQARAEDPAPAPSQAAVKHSLESLLPSGVRISDVRLSGLRVAVNGVGENSQQVSQMLHKLDASGVFQRPDLSSISKTNAGDMAFALTVEVRCPKPGEHVANNPCGTSAEAAPSVYKCTINSASTYQSTPCATGGKH